MKMIAANLLIIGIGLVVLFSCATGVSPTCNVHSKLVESTIAAKAREFNGQEYCQFRHYQTLIDIDEDGHDDFIVLFTVEGIGGGNDHYDFMSVFLSRRGWKPIVTRTGGRGERDPIAVDVRDGKIILSTLEYLPQDAMCCPSGKGTLVYEIHGDKLELVSEKENHDEPSAAPDRNESRER